MHYLLYYNDQNPDHRHSFNIYFHYMNVRVVMIIQQ